VQRSGDRYLGEAGGWQHKAERASAAGQIKRMRQASTTEDKRAGQMVMGVEVETDGRRVERRWNDQRGRIGWKQQGGGRATMGR
jgi:hypothetical protein